MSLYMPRTVDAELDELLRSLPAVALEGPKGVGKTVTAARRARTVLRFDDLALRELARADAAAMLTAPTPILLDEWQHVPALWDAVRRAVDNDQAPNRFLLAGSATPVVPPTHSGAGRIVTVRMRPLALSERGIGTPTVSLKALLTGTHPPVTGRTTVGLAGYAEEITRSGLPGLRHLDGRALRAQLDGYLTRIVRRDFVEQGHAVRKPATLRRWMAAYAAATATTATLEAIRDAATRGDGTVPARATVVAYHEILQQLWIADPIPGWLPSRNPFTRLGQLPKHHLADTALAARLLGVDAHALLTGAQGGVRVPRDSTLLGRLFESLIAQSISVYAQSAEAHVHHLREKDGRHEVDLIVERDDHRVLGIEVKLGGTIDDGDVRHLRWLKEKLGADVLDLVIITTGPQAYRRPDGIAVVPAALLGP